MKRGWEVVSLREISQLITKGTTPTSAGFAFTNTGINFLKVEAIAGNGELKSSKFAHVDDCCHTAFKRSQLADGDILFSIAGALGRVALVTQDVLPANTNQALAIVRLQKDRSVFARYVFRVLSSRGVQQQIEKMRGGVAQQNLSLEQVNNLKIPLPPLEEQKRIVAILDEAFEGLDRAAANAKKNLANARELEGAAFKFAFDAKNSDWLRTTIGDQLELQRGFDITKKHQNDGQVPVVSSGGIKSFHDTAMVKGPGVVLGRKGSIGAVFYVENDFWPHDTTLWVKDFKGNDAKFVYYFLKNLKVSHLDTGAANPALNRNLVHPIPVFWPAIKLQTSIVALLDEVSSEANRLGELCTQKLAAILELKQSILQKAFVGELTEHMDLAA